jgi:hypothetical protein
MKPPRFLAVPFDLGRPFGAPNQPEFQTLVLQSALLLLEREDGPPVLDIFTEDAPVDEEESDTAWSCPVSFVPNEGIQAGRIGLVLNEMKRLMPWHEVFVQTRGREANKVSGLDLPRIFKLLDELADGNPAPETGSETPLPELIRLSIDDIRTWYGEASLGQPGKGSFQEVNEWFWTETAVAHLIAAAAVALENHPDPIVRTVADRAMVQRQYKEHLFTALKKTKV